VICNGRIVGTGEWHIAPEAVLELLQKECTRDGDKVMYGKHCTKGMYREAVKWGVRSMHLNHFAHDGRQISKFFEEIGVHIGKVLLLS